MDISYIVVAVLFILIPLLVLIPYGLYWGVCLLRGKAPYHLRPSSDRIKRLIAFFTTPIPGTFELDNEAHGQRPFIPETAYNCKNFMINPSTGLPMKDGIDTSGNPIGFGSPFANQPGSSFLE